MSLRLPYALAVLCVAAPFAAAAAPPVGIDSNRITILFSKLDEDAFETRQAADDELRGMGPGVVAYLREEHLRTASPEVRHRLDRIIRDLAIREHVPVLVGQLGHQDARYRASAEKMLLKAGPGHLAVLLGCRQRPVRRPGESGPQHPLR